MISIVDTNITYLLLSTTLFTLWIYWLWTRRHLYRLGLQFPHFIGLPYIGCLLRIKHIDNLLPSIGKMFTECKSNTFYTWLGLSGTIITKDPELIKYSYTSADLLNKIFFLRGLKPIFGNGIIFSPVEIWQHHRKHLNPVFQRRNLQGFLPVINRGTRALHKEFCAMANDGKTHDIYEMLKTSSLCLVIEIATGRYMTSGEMANKCLINKFNYVIQGYSKKIIASILHVDFIYVLHRKLKHELADLLNFVEEQVTDKWDNYKTEKRFIDRDDEEMSGKNKHTNFVDRSLELYQNGIFSWKDVLEEVANIAIANFETTTNTLFSALIFLAMHPHIQEHLFVEIKNHFPNKDFEMQYEDMAELPYLDMVINETMRLAPAIPLLGREATKDTKVQDLFLPESAQILVSVFHLHRCPDIWGPNANHFNPDNFLPENVKNRHSWAFMPFSKGPRNCIGYLFAIYALKVMLSGLIRSYRVETDMRFEELEPFMNVSLRYKKEPAFKIYNRN